MKWSVETLDAAVDAELNALPVALRARITRIAELIEISGLENIGAPHVAHLDGKLWEIRAKAKGGIARALYVTVKDRRVVILHVFTKKTQKTPIKELAIAKERAKKVLK